MTDARQNRDDATAKQARCGCCRKWQGRRGSTTGRIRNCALPFAEQVLVSATTQRDETNVQVADAQRAIGIRLKVRITTASKAKSDAEAALIAAKNKAATDLYRLGASQKRHKLIANTANKNWLPIMQSILNASCRRLQHKH